MAGPDPLMPSSFRQFGIPRTDRLGDGQMDRLREFRIVPRPVSVGTDVADVGTPYL